MNKEVYEKNLIAYKERYNIDYKEIEDNEYDLMLEDTKDGYKTLQIDKNGKKIYLNSKYNTQREIDKHYKDFSIRYGTIIFVFGFGLSYYVSKLIEKISNTDYIFIYEPDKKIFDVTMKNIDISYILANKNINIIFEHKETKKAFMKTSLDKRIDINPYYKELYNKDLLEYMKDIKEGIEDNIININTTEIFKEEWSRSLFFNINSILKSYDICDFKDIFKDKPIVVVGAGPSLDKNVHLLKEIEGKVCIICAFSAAKALEKHNIKPDFLTTVDSKQYGIEEYEANIPILYLKEANKELLEKHKSKKIIYMPYTDILLKDILKIENKFINLPIKGTVSSFSASIAHYFGASEIIVIGQDFSWTKDKAHAEGTVHKKTEGYKKYHGENMEVKDIYGNTVYTNKPFYGFKLWFDDFTKQIMDSTKVIQATEGGLPIENAETMCLKDAIEKYCVSKFYNVNEILENKYKETEIIGKNIDEKQVFENIKNLYLEIKDKRELAKEALELSKKITKNIKYSSSGLKKNNNAIRRLDEIDEVLKENNSIKQLVDVFSNQISSYYMIEQTDDEKLDFAIMNEKLYYNIYVILSDLVDIIKEEMKYEEEE